jgi:hypothetical protein
LTFAVGDLGGGVTAQGSGDAGLAAKRKLVKPAKACFLPAANPTVVRAW